MFRETVRRTFGMSISLVGQHDVESMDSSTRNFSEDSASGFEAAWILNP
ncbi:MAG: hypothetical protein MZW92_07700 [Comamonadaceae bacterium]|nr:hypothetical protein [Comamonadaceae bacterium]